MGKFLIVSKQKHLMENSRLAAEYHMGYEYNDFYLPDVLENAALQRQIMDTYKRTEIPEYCTMHGAFLDVMVFSMDPRIREISELRMKQSMEIAKEIGARAVVFHTNVNAFLVENQYKERAVSYTAAYLKKLLQEYAGISIYLENMFDNDPEILREISEELKDFENYGVCLDYAHANISSTPLSVWVERLQPYIRHLHINDNDGISDLHLAVGEGDIDWDRFKEYYELYFTDCTVLIETTSPERQMASVKYLQKLGIM